MTENLGAQLAAQLMPIVVELVVAVVGAFAVTLIRSMKAKADGDYAKGVIERVEKLALPAVAEQWQRTVADLKKQASDGRLTKAEAGAAFEAARDRVRAGLTKSGVSQAEKIFGRDELEKIIAAKIESAVVEFADRSKPSTEEVVS